MKLRVFICIIFLSFISERLVAASSLEITSEILVTEKMYTKEYFSNGILKAEGWQSMNTKTDYWIFYHENGQVAAKGHFNTNKKEGYWYYYTPKGDLEKEGHYNNDIAEDWWIFYDIAVGNKIKFQYKNNQKNGFALHYIKRKLVKAEKYINDTKVGEWDSLWAFKRDNPDATF